ncbi:hypothetical protein OUZ56_033816 [Daphnia magna]|uniref:Uncharacterized protein n=1 Tax=Daphnia magna TaxID=35525 RepID=A0ABR0BB50_9CRUS|nr:hypothetical protein OUZ56_033816 [Daphnia magna]
MRHQPSASPERPLNGRTRLSTWLWPTKAVVQLNEELRTTLKTSRTRILQLRFLCINARKGALSSI